MNCKDHQTDAEHLPYMSWHSKAAESHRKGMKQQQCAECRRYFWPWEMKAVARKDEKSWTKKPKS